MPGQRQEGGDDSTNVLAGRDVSIHVGVSLEEARTIALDVFRANFMELQGVAADVARARAEAITEDFLARLQVRSPQSLRSASDPDMQRALFSAQREFACSGEQDLQEALVDLLVDRAERTDRGILTIVLNEAINSAPKLTTDQRRAIAVCFFLRYTRWRGPASVDAFYELNLKPNLLPIASALPRRATAYQHIEYVGAGAVGIGQILLATALGNQRGWFTRGFTADEVPDPLKALLDNPNVFMPCIRDSDRFQLAAMTDDDIDHLAESANMPEHSNLFRNLYGLGVMSDAEIREELLFRLPEAAELADVWDTSPLRHLTLTSVGVAIGHGYWRRTTSSAAPLSIWISE